MAHPIGEKKEESEVKKIKIKWSDVFWKMVMLACFAYFSAESLRKGSWWYFPFLAFLTVEWILMFALGKMYTWQEEKRLKNWHGQVYDLAAEMRERDLELDKREALIEASSGTRQERLRVLAMIEKGILTPEQAESLYEKIVMAYNLDDSDAQDLPPHPLEMSDEELQKHWDEKFKGKNHDRNR